MEHLNKQNPPNLKEIGLKLCEKKLAMHGLIFTGA
jgi:hypothetical protein